MFDTVRAHRRILLAVILLLIMPAFVFFGVSGYERMFGGGDEVAVVGGEPIALRAESICVHGDSAEAVEMARSIRARLQAEGVSVASFA